MAVTSTTLSADMSATALKITVASGSGFPTSGGTTPQSYLTRIDDEFMFSVLQPASGVITLRGRGSYGTAAVAHDLLAKVIVSSDPQDFDGIPAGADSPLPPYQMDRVTIGENRTFTSAEIFAMNRDTLFSFTKASAATATLVAPSKAQDGLVLQFTSLTDAAHVVVGTSLLASGGASSPYTTATMDQAKAGGGLRLIAENGLWNVVSSLNWSLT